MYTLYMLSKGNKYGRVHNFLERKFPQKNFHKIWIKFGVQLLVKSSLHFFLKKKLISKKEIKIFRISENCTSQSKYLFSNTSSYTFLYQYCLIQITVTYNKSF